MKHKYHGAEFKSIKAGYVDYRVEWRKGNSGVGYYWKSTVYDPDDYALEDWEWIGEKDSDVVRDTYLHGELNWALCKKSVLKQYFS